MVGLPSSLIACLLITQYLSAQSSALPRERKWELEIHATGFVKVDSDQALAGTTVRGAGDVAELRSVPSRPLDAALPRHDPIPARGRSAS